MPATHLTKPLVLGSSFQDDRIWLLFVFRCKQFSFTVQRQDLEHSSLADQYENLNIAIHESGHDYQKYFAATSDLAQLIITLCRPILNERAPPLERDISFEDVRVNSKFLLKLESRNALLECVLEGEPTIGPIGPFLSVPIPSDLSPSIPRLEARDILLTKDSDTILNGFPSEAIWDGIRCFFKPAVSPKQTHFQRELRILSQLLDTGLAGRLKVSHMIAVVISSDGTEILGLLLEYIDGISLLQVDIVRRRACTQLWEDKAADTLRHLHTNGIVWGDVNEGNIMISGEEENVWLVDFEGGRNNEFIDAELEETEGGDWQGLARVFAKGL